MVSKLARWQIRLLGAFQLAIAGLLFAWVLHWLYDTSQRHTGQRLPGGIAETIAFGIPGALALAGLLQLATGLRYSELESTWHSYDKVVRTFVAALALILFAILLIVGVQYYYADTPV